MLDKCMQKKTRYHTLRLIKVKFQVCGGDVWCGDDVWCGGDV